MAEDTDLTNAVDATGTSSDTSGSYLDYLKAAGGITNSVLTALNANKATNANTTVAALNAASAANKAKAANTTAATYTKIAIIAGGALLVVVLLVTLFKRK